MEIIKRTVPLTEADDSFGLSSSNRNYIVGLVFFALLMLGPVQPYGMIVRTIYLIAIPVAVWLALRLIGRRLDIDTQSNDYINRGITASLAGMLVLAAFQLATVERHTECTRSAPDGDCIGEFITKSGPDKGTALMLVLFAGFAFWSAITRRTSK
jgi:hypothetical protein